MGLLQKLRHTLRVRTLEEIERDYLEASASPVDLEMRMREVDRGKFRRYPRFGL
jgi:hypothetical protein